MLLDLYTCVLSSVLIMLDHHIFYGEIINKIIPSKLNFALLKNRPLLRKVKQNVAMTNQLPNLSINGGGQE